ncbi:chloride channel protein [Lacticaseibacillus mingshuiensis]|uniref:Chloride channel protein n=1 Tax=Lacticaseibacillus mingshuiensis TaxID=2799574 RepID=A0ABW4CHA4_9LACO|nr:chloride channel protein [Lacticaseibacillus mingshuiensis]
MKSQHHDLILAISTVVLGVGVGFASLLLGLIAEAIVHLFLNFTETAAQPVAWAAGSTRRLVSLLIGGCLAAVIWYLMRRRMRPTVSIAQALLEKKEMPPATTTVHVLTQILYVSVGGSVGRELAPRELGAMLAQSWERVLHKMRAITLSKEDRRLLIAAAAGAGFAGIYLSPLTGTMFALELLLKKADLRAVLVSLPMAVIAMLIGSLHRGFAAYYALGGGAFDWRVALIAVVLGPVCGVVGALFRMGFRWATLHSTRDKNLLWQLPLMAAITGLIAMQMPQIMGNGRALAEPAMTNTQANLIGFFLLAALAKALVTVFTLRAGAAGGTLTPSIAIGGVLGMTAGIALAQLGLGLPIWQVAVLGAASLLAASQQAPLMAMFMLFEVSHLHPTALVPLAIGTFLAWLVARACLSKWQSAPKPKPIQ